MNNTWHFVIYVAVCLILYFGLRFYFLHSNKKTLPIPSDIVFYLLQFTWGLTLNLCGWAIGLALILGKKRPKKYRQVWCFELPIDFGLSLGTVILCPEDNEGVKQHEYGHSIQNAYLGSFMLWVVCVPSVIRFWWRKLKPHRVKTAYNDIWFEGQATLNGKQKEG